MEEMKTTIIADLEKYAHELPGKPAVCDKKRQLTYQELLFKVKREAAILKEHGVRCTDKIAVLAVSGIEYVVSYLAIQYLGAVTVPLDKSLGLAAMEQICEQTQVRLCLTNERQRPAQVPFLYLKEIMQDVFEDESIQSLDEKLQKISYKYPNDFEQPSEMLFTSGTTGVPKGVVLSYRAISASMENTSQGNGLKETDVMLLPLPLGHSFGMRVLRACIHMGATIVLQNGFTFARDTQRSIDTFGCTAMAAVPASLGVMELQMKKQLPEILGKLRYIEFGAGSLSPQKKRELMESLPNTEIHNTWGSTETGGAVFLNLAKNPEKYQSIGKPLESVTVRIQNTDGMTVTGYGPEAVGRMQLKGDLEMSGYWKREPETAAALVDGWLVTNDLVYRDEDGFVYMLGRADDMINTGGEKVSPVEVENAASGYEQAAECACVGVADPKGILGEIVVLFVVPKAGRFDEAGMTKFLSERLERFKLPQAYVLLEELPRNRMQKLDRRALKTIWQERKESRAEEQSPKESSASSANDAGDTFAQSVISCIKSRHSVRRFEDRPVPQELLDTIIECGIYAPSGKNMQTWRFTVLTDKKQICHWKELVISRAAEHKVRVSGFENPAALVLISNDIRNKNGAQDSSCAAENIMLAANAYGLGSVWINALLTMCDDEEIRNQLKQWGIPERHQVWAMIALGYPEGEAKSPKRNLDVVHYVK